MARSEKVLLLTSSGQHVTTTCTDHLDDERLERTFKSLDNDGNGRIDIHDLSAALKGAGVNQLYAKKFLERTDKNKSGDITLKEFINYVKEHEKNLKLVFSTFDKNRDGKLDADELVRAFKELGIEIDRTEAVKLVQRMDQDGSLNISYNEWRDFLLYAPSSDVKDLITYWRHSSAVYKYNLRDHRPRSVLFPPFINMYMEIEEDFDPRAVQFVIETLLQIREQISRYLDIGEDLNVPDDFTANEMVSGMWWRHLVAGGIAGGVSRTCTAPLDRLKVYLQVHGTRGVSLRSCLRHMLQEGGIWSLWRGNGINVLKIAPESAIKFMAYEQAKRAIRRNHTRELSIYERFAAGSIAGGISQTIIYPLEVMKTRLALRKTGEYRSISDAARKIYLREGLRSFYRGYIPNLLGIIPYAGIDLAVYETLKNSYIRQHATAENSSSHPSVLLLLACGTVSSTCGQVCSYPLALVRTQLQAKVVTNVQEAQACTMVGTFRTIVQREGVSGLYRGLTPNFLKVVPAVSISYVVYERCRQTLGVNMT